MKKIFLTILLLLIHVSLLFSQGIELLEVGLKTGAFEGKSYIYTKSVSIKPVPGQVFRVNATEHGAFFIRPAEAARQAQDIPPSMERNFIRTETMLVGATTENTVSGLSVTQRSTDFAYMDGLGRTEQNILVSASPSKLDLVTPLKYDADGRMPRKYLNYPSSNSAPGKFLSNAVANQGVFYGSPSTAVADDDRPFEESLFENSSLNRVETFFGPGEAWVVNGEKNVKSYSKINLDQEVPQWLTYSGGYPQLLSSNNGYYAAGNLFVEERTDEDGVVVRSFKNFKGQIVLNRTGDGSNWNDTHYIYDALENLVFVIQPEGVARLAAEYHAGGADKQSFLDRWCFQYKYDDEQREIAKRVPGWKAGYWAYTVYDKWSRVVLTQTPAQRDNSNQWTFNKYDRFNRIIVTGLITYSATSNADNDRQTVQNAVNTLYIASTNNVFETEVINATGYTLGNTFPQNPSEGSLVQINYYDNYSFLDFFNWDAENPYLSFSFINEPGFPQSSDRISSVKGYLTGSKTRMTGSSRWLNSVTHYDEKYRPIQVIKENHLGPRDHTTTQYDFVDKVLKEQHNHAGYSATLTTLREFEYDHAGRFKNLYHTINGSSRILMVSNKYNEIGQLIEKNIHSTDNGASFLQSVDYRYNIRGWLTSINNSTLSNDGSLNNDSGDLFGMELLYNHANMPTVQDYPNDGTTTALPKLYNGNITGIKWKTDTKQGTSQESIFGFDYDALNRLEKAHYATNTSGAWTGNSGMFDEQVTSYDKNGNIKGIVRSGKINGSKTSVDNLTHTYLLDGKESNRLISLSDASGNTLGFKDGANTTEEYKYDASGNLIYDNNKSISSITYNHLNLPTIIEFTRADATKDRIEYTYDASGIKLQTIVKINGTQVAKTDYVGDAQYDNGQLTFVSTSEGRVVKNGSGFDYEYFHKDHQGNVRLTYGLLKETVSYRATMETPPSPSTLAQDEENTFRNISSTTRYTDLPTGEKFNFTKSSSEVLSPDKSLRTNGISGKIIGPAKSLRLLSGDKVRMEVMAKYNQVSGSSTPVAASALMAALATTTFGFNPGETGHSSFTTNASVIPGVGPGSATLPKAYMAYLFFNDSYQFVAGNSGAVSISTSAYNAFEKLERLFTAPQNGYLYIYVANESDRNVYFDEMLLVHQKNTSALQVTQASDYYPFGLSFNTYQADRIGEDHKPLQKNRYGFQGQELQKDLDLGWSQFKWRMHDPAIGRFGGVDPLSDKYLHNSTYAFSENKTVSHIELEGLEAVTFQASFRGAVPIYYAGVTSNGTIGVAVGYPNVNSNEIYYVPFASTSVGLSGGVGITGGLSYTITQAPLENLSGFGFAIGGFLPIRGGNLGGELNSTTSGDIGGNSAYGLPKNWSFTIGGAVYGEVNSTVFLSEMKKLSEISDMEFFKKAFNMGTDEIKLLIENMSNLARDMKRDNEIKMQQEIDEMKNKDIFQPIPHELDKLNHTRPSDVKLEKKDY